MRMPGALRTVGVWFAATLLAAPLVAQGSVVLTVTGGPVTIPAPAVADYNAGLVLDATPVQYNVNISGGPPTTLHTTIVTIRSTSGSFGTLALGNLEWRRSDLLAWNGLTAADVTIESRQISRNNGNNWTNSILFRSVISWTGTPPATYTANLVVTLTVTTP